MPGERKIIELPFPVGGLDRRLAYQRQSPQTTPSALNVRSDATIELRERGGVRPALAPAFQTQVSGGANPIRMLASVDIVDEASFTYWSDSFRGTTIGGIWSLPAGITTEVLPDVQNQMAQADSKTVIAVRDALSISISNEYVVEMFIRPYESGHHGTYYLYFWLDDAAPSVAASYCYAKLTLRSDGAYDGELYDQFAPNTYAFTAGNLGYAGSGWFSALVNDKTISIYWRNKLLLSQIISAAPANAARVGFKMVPDVFRTQIGSFRVQYTETGNLRNSRPMIVTSAGGEVYREKFMGIMEKILGNAVNEKQMVYFDAVAGAGTFTVTWQGPVALFTTVAIPYDDTDVIGDFQAAMEAHPDLDATKILVTRTDGTYTAWTLEWIGAEGGTNQSNISVDDSLLVGANANRVTTYDGSGSTEPAITSDRRVAAAVRNQLVYVADSEDPVVTGVDLVVGGADKNMLTSAAVVNWASAGPRSLPITISHGIRIKGVNNNESQRIEIIAATTGNYKLYIAPMVPGNETADIAWNDSLANVQTKIEAIELLAIGLGKNVTVTGVPGDYYDVEFIVDFANASVGMLTVLKNETDGQIKTRRLIKGTRGTDTAAVVSAEDGAYLSTTKRIITPGAEATFSYTSERTGKILDPKVGSIINWEADPGKGMAPLGCTIVTVYRDRMVLAGDPENSHEWYMSRLGDPHDFDYSQEDSARAVTGALTLAGQIGEPIRSLMSTTDECLIFGCNTSLWILRGDAAQGGQIDNLSHKIGVVDKFAWCYAPNAQLFFLSNDGIYTMRGDCGATPPSSISHEKIPDELLNVQPDLVEVQLEYNVQSRGVHIYLTRFDSTTMTHWFLDLETGAFWPEEYQTSHEPTAVIEYRPQDAEMNYVLLGCRDGYLRYYSRWDDQDDDGNEILNHVDLGPFHVSGTPGVDGIIHEIRGSTGLGGRIHWGLRTAASAEESMDATERALGEWPGNGAAPLARPRLRGQAAVLRLTGDDKRRWAMEKVIAVVESDGEQRL